jgi:D-sedoheptulose 7-phosphate isomerase
MIEEIQGQLQAHRGVIELIEREMSPQIAAAATLLADTFRNGGKLLAMGNGGSAADAQHFAAEIVGRFKLERPALPAVALSTDSSIMTAIGNDYGFDQVFRRQVEALAAAGDVVVGISTSGNSPNVLAALALARERGCRTIGLLGRDGGSIRSACDLALIVPSADTPRVQEGHITIIHILCDLLERTLFPVEPPPLTKGGTMTN